MTLPTFLFHPALVAVIVALAVFIVVYTQFDRVRRLLTTKSQATESEILDRLDRMLVDLDRSQLSTMLNSATYGLSAIAFLLAWPDIFVGGILGLIVMVTGWNLPRLVVNNLWEKRCDRIVEQMVDGLVMMTNSIKAGLSVPQAMERVVDNMTGPLPQEFNVILNKVRLGMSVEDALVEFAQKVSRPDVQMLVTSIVVLKETGGNLAETFATISTTIRERQKIEKKIQALTAQGRMQAMIISAIPFVLLGVFMMVDPNYIMPMFTTPFGWFLLALMLGLQTIGLVVMKRIITIKV